MPTASFWEILSCWVFVVVLEIDYFPSSVCSALFKTPAPILVWFYRCCCQLISAPLLLRNIIYCIFHLFLRVWMQSALRGLMMICCSHLKSSFSQTRYIFLEAEVEHYHGLLFCVESVTLSNKSTMKPLCWNAYRIEKVFFFNFLLIGFLVLLLFCQM